MARSWSPIHFGRVTLAHYVFAPAESPEIPDASAHGVHEAEKPTLRIVDPLVARLCSGEDDALRVVMQQYYQPLARFATSIVGAADVADDIVQDVFVALWNARARIDPARPLRAYLFTAARNHALNRVKSARAAQVMAERIASDAATFSEDELVTRLDDADDPARLAALDRAIALLPERRRTALALRFDQGLTFAEAGAVLGISAKAMQQLVIRTVAELRRVLRPR